MKSATTIGHMRVQEVDQMGQPLTGARLHVSVSTDENPYQPNRDYPLLISLRSREQLKPLGAV